MMLKKFLDLFLFMFSIIVWLEFCVFCFGFIINFFVVGLNISDLELFFLFLRCCWMCWGLDDIFVISFVDKCLEEVLEFFFLYCNVCEVRFS